jgi:hypothetical protein
MCCFKHPVFQFCSIQALPRFTSSFLRGKAARSLPRLPPLSNSKGSLPHRPGTQCSVLRTHSDITGSGQNCWGGKTFPPAPGWEFPLECLQPNQAPSSLKTGLASQLCLATLQVSYPLLLLSVTLPCVLPPQHLTALLLGGDYLFLPLFNSSLTLLSELSSL